MERFSRLSAFIPLLLALVHPAGAEEEKNLIEDLSFLIGDWEGRATLHFPNNPEREKRQETVSVNCEAFLTKAYILCQSKWSNQAGNKRELATFFSYHPEKGNFYTLYLYDNWADIVRYPVVLDEQGNSFFGLMDFENPDGTKAYEKIQWNFSKDRKTIIATEYVLSAKGDGWLLSFDFEWHKK